MTKQQFQTFNEHLRNIVDDDRAFEEIVNLAYETYDSIKADMNEQFQKPQIAKHDLVLGFIAGYAKSLKSITNLMQELQTDDIFITEEKAQELLDSGVIDEDQLVYMEDVDKESDPTLH